jgi:hypothetical protein
MVDRGDVAGHAFSVRAWREPRTPYLILALQPLGGIGFGPIAANLARSNSLFFILVR